MFGALCRVVGIFCFIACLFWAWEHWNRTPNPRPLTRSPVTKIIIGNSDGTEQVIWNEDQGGRRIVNGVVLDMDTLTADGNMVRITKDTYIQKGGSR